MHLHQYYTVICFVALLCAPAYAMDNSNTPQQQRTIAVKILQNGTLAQRQATTQKTLIKQCKINTLHELQPIIHKLATMSHKEIIQLQKDAGLTPWHSLSQAVYTLSRVTDTDITRYLQDNNQE